MRPVIVPDDRLRSLYESHDGHDGDHRDAVHYPESGNRRVAAVGASGFRSGKTLFRITFIRLLQICITLWREPHDEDAAHIRELERHRTPADLDGRVSFLKKNPSRTRLVTSWI